MTAAPSYFTDFLANIGLTQTQRDNCKGGHSVLRERLHNDAALKDIIVDTFLQGSYRRSTANKPIGVGKLVDVDVIVVTNLDRSQVTARESLDRFKPFLEKHYKGKYEAQGRSWGISLSTVALDLVPTSAPSQAIRDFFRTAYAARAEQTLAEQPSWRFSRTWAGPNEKALGRLVESATEDNSWKEEPLWIPDREANFWDKTHPLRQIEATVEKNAACNGKYLSTVRCLKWWRAAMQPEPKYPKSYPLEHLVWCQCRNGIDSVAQGVVSAFEGIRDAYAGYAAMNSRPVVPDHGVPEHNVLERVTGSDFAAFHRLVCDAAALARRAYDAEDLAESVALWKELFGDEFPPPPKTRGDDDSGGFTKRTGPSIIPGGRFGTA